MDSLLNELVAVIEEELAVAEQLRSNLDDQRKAIAAWDVLELMRLIEAKQPCVTALEFLEGRRAVIVKRCAGLESAPSLRELVELLVQDENEKVRLHSFRSRVRSIFFSLHQNEQSLHQLMAGLLAHFNEAIGILAQPPLPMYGDRGTAAPGRPSSGLIRGKV